jgi:hypothetical protein
VTEPQPDPVATAQGLTKALTDVAAEVQQLRKYGRRNRLFIVFDVLLTVLLTGVGFIAVHAGSQASQASSAQLALCEAGNVARAQQVKLWTHLLDLPAPKGAPPKTPAQVKQAAEFRVYLHQVFASRDCAALGKPAK